MINLIRYGQDRKSAVFAVML